MSWRYQPVKFVEDGEVVYMLCEVYFDKNGRFESWTYPPGICPSGEGKIDQLTSDLCCMLVDAYCWEPVAFQDLTPGMKFKRKATKKQRDSLATLVENIAHNLGEITKEPAT